MERLGEAAADLREAFPDPWLRAFSLKANDVPSVVARLAAAVEPGRFLVARAGWLVAGVLHVRERAGADGGTVRIVVLDAGMTELIRPAMYGPVCESTDTLGMHDLPPLRRGDLVAIGDAGAYATRPPWR